MAWMTLIGVAAAWPGPRPASERDVARAGHLAAWFTGLRLHVTLVSSADAPEGNGGIRFRGCNPLVTLWGYS